jgi:hypothetical protein
LVLLIKTSDSNPNTSQIATKLRQRDEGSSNNPGEEINPTTVDPLAANALVLLLL